MIRVNPGINDGHEDLRTSLFDFPCINGTDVGVALGVHQAPIPNLGDAQAILCRSSRNKAESIEGGGSRDKDSNDSEREQRRGREAL